MALIEKTQFSIIEVRTFQAEKREPKSSREQAMADFLVSFDTTKPETFASIGGLENLQRIRVLCRNDKTEYDLVPKLPPALVAERKAQAEKETKRKKIMAELELLRADPKAMEKFIQDVVAVALGRAVALSLLQRVRPALRQPTAKPTHRKPAPRKPASKRDAFERALAQDRRNRIEAAKKAAAQYHSNAKGMS